MTWRKAKFYFPWVSVLALLSEGAAFAGSPLDASYFLDADQLKPPGIAEVADLGKLPPAKIDFCSRTSQDIRSGILNSPETETLAFFNPPGDLHTYLCWLHTRFQRNAAYLIHFRPDLPKPSISQAKSMITQVADGENVVEIPGYGNLFEFSKNFEAQITRSLNTMAYEDLANLKLADRLLDTRSIPQDEFAAIMDDIYNRQIQNPHLMFLRQRAQHHTTPFVSHALLLLEIKPITEPNPSFRNAPEIRKGYVLRLLDSNSPNEIIGTKYLYGDTQLNYCLFAKKINPATEAHRCRAIGLHLDYEEDVLPMERAIQRYCKK